MLSPSPIHLPCAFDGIIEKLELLDEGGANISVDDMKEVWDQLSEPTSSPASSSEANSPSIMASSSDSDELGHHLEETARFMTRISPPLTPLPPITLIYQVPTKPKNRNPYLCLEDNIIEIHFSYTIPMKVQLYLPGDPAVELPYPVSLYAKLTQVDTDRDMTDLLAFETPTSASSSSIAPSSGRKIRPSVGLQCCTNFRGEAVLLPKVLKPEADPPSQATGRYVLRFSAVVEGQHHSENDTLLSILSHVDTVQIHTKAKHPRFTKDLAEDVVQLLDEEGRCTLVRHSEYQLRRLQNIFGHKTIRTPNLCLVTEIFSGETELKWDDFLARFLYFHPHVDDTVLRYLLLEPSGTVTRTAFKLLCEWVGKRWTEKIAQLAPFCRRHFHGLITAAEAEEQVGAAIRDRSADVSGFYLIRMSTSTPGFFALTFTTEKAAKMALVGDETVAVPLSASSSKKRKRAIRYHHLQLYFDEQTRRLREDHDPAAVEYVSIEDFLMRNTDVFRTEVTRKSRTVKTSKPKRRKSDVAATPSPSTTPAPASASVSVPPVASALVADQMIKSAPLTAAVANNQSISANSSGSDLSLISNAVKAVEIAV